MGRLEARTEDMFAEHLRNAGYTKENGITVDRQTCTVNSINELLAHSSKNETGRPGYPDFIITNKSYPGIIIIAECKAEPDMHTQAAKEAIGYAQAVSKNYDVVVVAVSGKTETEFRISTERW